VERTQSGVNQLYIKAWNGSAWVPLGSGALNNDLNTGWAFRPSLVADANSSSLYVAWVEQQSLGQKAQTYVQKYSAGTLTALGGTLNVDPQGSAERVSLTVLNGQPVVAWGEVKPGALRQIYVKQWNGSTWALLGGASKTSSCDLNSDNQVNIVDVQLALNQVFGITACTTADLQNNGTCNVTDVQRIINAVLGGPCVTGF
jgi:hypothetical protein